MDASTAVHYLTFVPAILLAITFHEFAHARTALYFGDTTALDRGRVTLNPLAHLDPVGTIGLLFLGFGWGKPVPVDVRNLRFRQADLFVSAAGPAANLLCAAAAAFALRIPGLGDLLERHDMRLGAELLLTAFVRYNLVLALFNFLPLYPLDGSHMVSSLLPLNAAIQFNELNRRYGQLILIGMIASGYILPVSVTWMLLGPPMQFLEHLLLG